MAATKMHFRHWRLLVFSMLCVLLICLAYVWNLTAQDAPKGGPSLALIGPDDEEYLTCSVPSPLSLDTTVYWYADRVLIHSETLLRGMVDSEVSVDDLFDILGRMPEEVQCSISDENVGYVSVMSNVVYLEEEEESVDEEN